MKRSCPHCFSWDGFCMDKRKTWGSPFDIFTAWMLVLAANALVWALIIKGLTNG